MSIEITEVRNAQSINSGDTIFDVEINHPVYGWIPYTLSPADPDTTINNDELLTLIGSDYAEYVAPTEDELAAVARDERDRLLRNLSDPVMTNSLRFDDLTDSKKSEWTQYRLDLLNVPQQEDFPNTINWPTPV